MSQSGSYSGSFSGGGGGSSGGATVVVSISGSFSTSFTVGDDGLLSGTWQYSGSLTGTATAEDLTVPINESVAGGGPLSGTLAAFSGSATSGPLAGFSAGISGGVTSFSFSGGGSAEGVSVSVSGSASGSLSDTDTPPPPPPPTDTDTPPPDEGPYVVATVPDAAGWDAVPIGDGMRFVGPQFNVDDATGAWSLVSPPAPGTYTVDEAQYVSGLDRSSYLEAVSQTLTWGAILSRDAGAPQIVQDVYGNAATAISIFNMETNIIHRLFDAMEPAALVNAATFGTGVAEVEAKLAAAQGQTQDDVNQAAQDAVVDAATQGTFAEYLVNFWRSAKLVSHHSAESFTMQNGSAAVVADDHHDVMLGTSGGDAFYAGANDDIAIGWLGPDSLRGGDGNDQLYGGGGYDTLVGDAGADFIVGGLGNDQLMGGMDNDTLRGAVGADTLRGGLGNDLLVGGTENDQLFGGENRDTLDGGDQNDWLDGGNGLDSLIGGNGFDQVFGGLGNDTLRGGFQGDTLNGGDGNDWVFGGGGLDVVAGAQGDDTVVGGDGNDTVTGGAGNDSLSGALGNDLLTGGAGNDTIDGGAGNDLLDFGIDTAGVHVSLMAGGTGSATSTAVGADSVVSVEGALGGAGADTLEGADSMGGYYFSGGAGNDLISGNAQADTLLGSLGDDSLVGGVGNDLVQGGQGIDTLLGGAGNDTLSGGPGNDSFVWTATSLGADDLAAHGLDNVIVDTSDVFDIGGVIDELNLAGMTLNALTADADLGTAIDANNAIAYVGGVIRIDVDGNNTFNATNDFQIDLTGSGVTTVTYDNLNDQLTFG